jgi:hypothetical protein
MFSFSSIAQNESNSPFSRFGLGDLQNFTTATQFAMGGAGIGFYDYLSINVNNPASYTSILNQRFIMQTGGAHSTKLLQTSTQNQVVNSTNFNYLMFAFPVSKFWGSSFGLLPYSEMSYSFTDQNTNPSAQLLFKGNGGLSKLYFGHAISLNKNLSLGANLNYLFGNLNSNRKVIFEDESILNTRTNDDTNIKGLYFDFGMMYKAHIKDWQYVMGFSFDNGGSISAKRTLLTETFRSSGDFEIVEDTVARQDLNNGTLELPIHYGMGLSLSNEQWTILADYRQENWSQYKLFGVSDSLDNSTKLSIGLEFVPDKKAINKYYKLIRYRLGWYSNQTYLNINQEQLNENALTVGVGLPLKRSGSLLNLSVAMGKMGTIDDHLIQEKFLRFKIGFIFSDIWFIKRKYD